jgi:hypothetical protein
MGTHSRENFVTFRDCPNPASQVPSSGGFSFQVATMLCLECGAEMRLIRVAKDTMMLVSGYEHHTWQCSGCSTVEQRMTFNREKLPPQTVPVELAQPMLVEATGKVPGQPTQAIPAESIQTASVAPIETVLVKSTQAAPVEPTQIVPPESTYPEPSTAMPKMNARAKALDEKLRNLKERAKAAREAASETARTTQFNRDWDNRPRSAPPSSASSEVSSHVKPDEPLRFPTEPIACPSHDEPIVPGESNAPIATRFRKRLGGLVRAVRRRELSEVRFNQVSTP